jgi:4-hydroxy-3-methylbut-2-enyl diphosphate reductase IspH
MSGQSIQPRMPRTGCAFDRETTRVLGVALELSCIALRVGDCADDVKQAIADKIIALAKESGERNPDILCEQVVKDIRSLGIEAETAPTRNHRPIIATDFDGVVRLAGE